MKDEARRVLTVVASDGTNELMLNQHGFPSSLLNDLVASGHLRIERRRYGARSNGRLDIRVRRFHVTAAGHAALMEKTND
jgi:hypothetical protein